MRYLVAIPIAVLVGLLIAGPVGFGGIWFLHNPYELAHAEDGLGPIFLVMMACGVACGIVMKSRLAVFMSLFIGAGLLGMWYAITTAAHSVVS